MMTQEQVAELAKYFQIDGFTIAREYLQLVFLNCLYQNRKAKEIYFKGGTAIRLLFQSPRFSEDLDFSTTLSREEIAKIIEETAMLMRRDLPEVKILFLYSGKEGIRFRIKYESVDFKSPQVVRLDFTIVKKVNKSTVSSLETRFPVIVFPVINHLTAENIFAEKLLALKSREKGRDLYDVWFLLHQKTVESKNLRTKKLIDKIEKFSQGKLARDLRPFLPRSQREIIPLLKEWLLKKLF